MLMASSAHLPTLLVQDALHAVALRGRDGLLLDALWPMLPRLAAGDAAGRAFVWSQLRTHEHIESSLASATPAQVGALVLEEAGSVHLVASAALRNSIYGPADGEAFESLSDLTGEMLRVVEEVAARSEVGELQNVLTRAVGIPANKLAYSLAILESEHVILRRPVWVSTGCRAQPSNRCAAACT